MKIYNQEKTMQLLFPDMEKGCLIDDKIKIGFTEEVFEVKEQGHYEIEKEFQNGGKELMWIVDVQHVSPKASEPIFEDIKVYIPYSAAELNAINEERFCELHKANIEELSIALQYLRSTDYKAIQFSEGVLPAFEFEPIKQMRENARSTVRRLQKFISDARLNAGL